jgi:hypothetical protein
MPSTRKFSVILAGSVLALILLGQAGLSQDAAPPTVTTDSAKVELPIKATLSDDARKDLLQFFSQADYRLGQKWASVALNDLLLAQRATIEAQDPRYFTTLSTHIAELTATAQKAITQQMTAKFAASFNQTADLLKADLEKDKPALLIRDKYIYDANSRDHATPGWTSPPQATLIAGEAFTRTGTVELTDIELTVPGTTIKLPLKLRVAFTLATTFVVGDPNVCEGARDVPDTVVGATPSLITKASLDITSNGAIGTNGSFLSLSCTKKFELPRARSQFVAQPAPKDPS